MAGVTTLIVASRPSTIALADDVVFLSDGRVVAHGRHRDLFRHPGLPPPGGGLQP
jgi:ATP-binding cassette subfamily B protein